MQWELHPTLPPPQPMTYKINITSLTLLSAGVWPTLHHLHTLHSLLFFSIHTNYSSQQRETYKLTDNRTDSSSSAAVENKITQSSPELQDGFHSSHSSGFLEANAKVAPVLPAPQQQPGSPREKIRFPKSQKISVLLCPFLFFKFFY